MSDSRNVSGLGPWFSALKLDLFELATHPTMYGQEEHGDAHEEALKALVSLGEIADAAEALIERTITDPMEIGQREVRLSQLLRAARNASDGAENSQSRSAGE